MFLFKAELDDWREKFNFYPLPKLIFDFWAPFMQINYNPDPVWTGAVLLLWPVVYNSSSGRIFMQIMHKYLS